MQKKITYTIGSLGFGGKERQLLYLLKHLPETVEKQLIVFSKNIEYKEKYEIVDNIIVIEREKKYRLSTITQLYSKIKAFNPDIIHAWDSISPLLFKPYCKKNNCKLIYGGIRSAGPQNQKIKKRIKHWIRVFISDLSISNSIKGLEILKLEKYSFTKVIYNGINLKEFDNQNTSLKLDNDSIKICMVGRFNPPKDYKSLIEVISHIQGTAVEFIIIGDGPDRAVFEDKLKNEKLDNVKLLGKRNDVPGILKYCDIGILLNPKHVSEGISNAIMEYMAAGLPIVATNSGGTPELVNNLENGILVEPEDVEGIEKAMRLLIHNKSLRKCMGVASRQIIEQSFSMENMIKEYTKIYQRDKF